MTKAKEVLSKLVSIEEAKPSVINGYKGLQTEFWGLEQYKSSAPKSWDNKKVMFVDLDDSTGSMADEMKKAHRGQNEKEVVVRGVTMLALAADGGFNSYLIDAKDYDKVKSEGPGIEFV